MPDNNWKSYYGDNPDTSEFVNPPYPNTYDDIMKFSDCLNVVVKNKQVSAGKENCVDAVRGTNYEWRDCEFFAGSGISAITLKGALDGWRIIDSKIGHGKQTDIELGQFDNYWKPGRSPTRNGLIYNCQSNDGQPIRVTCWDAQIPQVIDSNVKITKVPWIVWFPYFCFRYVCVHWLSR